MSTSVQPQAQRNEAPRRIIGIDLGVTARHRAAILNPATNQFVVRTLRFRPVAKEIDALLRKAKAQESGRGNSSADPSAVHLTATLEATHMSWYLVSHYLQQQGVTVYRVNGRMTKQLRRVATPHAQSDAIDAQVLARLPGACPEQLFPLTVPMVDSLALKRYVLEYARWRTSATAIKNRLTAYDHAFWPGIAAAVPAQARDWVRENWFDPWEVLAVGEDALQEAWLEAEPRESGDWIHDWYRFTAELSRLYVAPLAGMHHLQSLIRYQLRQLAYALEQQKVLMQEYILPLYRDLSPQSLLTTIYGIAEPSAAIYHAYIQDISRFPTPAAFRQWCGIVPRSHQSGQHNAKGGRITQAGPNLIKATLYMNAMVARQYDIGLARVYYTQMVTHGKHHNQAAVACASHLASRIYAILSKKTPYEVRDLEGNPVSVAAAQAYIRAHFTVPEEVRLRSNTQSRSPSPLNWQNLDEQDDETTGDTSLPYPEEFADK